MIGKPCLTCGRPIRGYCPAYVKARRFCSQPCYHRWAKKARINRGARAGNWRGGMSLKRDVGYLVHNTVGLKDRYAHRVVIEKVLGRRLRPGEIVHHRNGVKTDNRPANLEVMTRAEHLAHHRAVVNAARWPGGTL